jgi:hypothetical protein
VAEDPGGAVVKIKGLYKITVEPVEVELPLTCSNCDHVTDEQSTTIGGYELSDRSLYRGRVIDGYIDFEDGDNEYDPNFPYMLNCYECGAPLIDLLEVKP